jgi:hypothetical protein
LGESKNKHGEEKRVGTNKRPKWVCAAGKGWKLRKPVQADWREMIIRGMTRMGIIGGRVTERTNKGAQSP